MWNQIVFDNELYKWIIAAVLITLLYFLKKEISHNISRLVLKSIQQQFKRFKDVRFEVSETKLIRPFSWLIFSTVSYFVLLNLRFPSILAYQILSVSSISVFHKTGFSILLFFTLKCLISIIDFIAFFWEEEAKKSIEKKDDQLILFLKSIAKAVTYIVGTLIILKSAFNFDLGAVLAGLSIVGAALALAAKESIENLIASFIIFFDQPFVVDDKVQVNNIIGKIEYIGLRSTTIRTPEHTLVTVPNKQMVDSIVDNMSKRNGRKTEMQLELEPQTPIDKINVLSSRLEGYFMNHPVIMNNFDLYISDLRKNSLVLYIKFHLPETESSEYRKIQQDFILFLKQSTDELNIKTV